MSDARAKMYMAVVMVVVVAAASCATAQTETRATGSGVGEWVTGLPDLPGDPRHHPITFSLNDIGYVMMGTGRPEVYAYNATQEAWVSPRLRTGLPPAREFAYGVSVGATGDDESMDQLAFLGLGRVGNSVLSDWYMFDGNSFYQRAPIPVGRYHPAMVSVQTAERGWSIYVGAGGGVAGNLRDWYEYSVDDDTWTRRPDLPGPERHHPYYWDARVGDKHYAFVGFGHGYGRPAILKDVYRYDPDAQAWERMADFPGEARVAGTQFTIHSDPATGRDRAFVLSGDGDNHSSMETGELWEYIAEEDEWFSHPPHPGNSRWAPGSFVIGCHVYFTCGYDRSAGILERDLMKDRLC